MHFNIKVSGILEVIRFVERVRDAIHSEKTMTEVGLLLRSRILARTSKGVDADNNPFATYSKRYAQYREKYGHQTSPVNLFWYGTMLNSIDSAVTPRSVRLFFQPTESPPYPRSISDATRDKESPNSALKAYYLQTNKKKPREFFAISDTDVDAIVRLLSQKIDEAAEA